MIDGPFAETKELVAGFSIWEVASMDEAVEWVKRSPVRDSEVELRKILDADDFDDVLRRPRSRRPRSAVARRASPPSSSDLSDPARHRRCLAHRISPPDDYAGLVRIVRDVGLAEDLAHDALVAALEQWPAERGVPRDPGAWLMGESPNTAALDHFPPRTNASSGNTSNWRVTRSTRSATSPNTDLVGAAIDDNMGDDLLRLVFVACHPVLSTDARAWR